MKKYFGFFLSLLILLSPLSAYAALTTNLVSYWKLDESSGNAADSVGSNTLTNTNTMPYVAGKINNGADTSSATKYISILDASQSGLDLDSDMSFSSWVNFTSIPGNGHEADLISKWGTSAATQGYIWYLATNGSAVTTFNLGLRIAGAGGFQGGGVTWTPSTGVWYHVVTTWNKTSGDAVFYVNGAQMGSTQNFGAGISVQNSPSPFYVGNDLTSPGEPIVGTMDEVGVWTRVLTSDEVVQLYNSGSGCQYNFTQGSATCPNPITNILRTIITFFGFGF